MKIRNSYTGKMNRSGRKSIPTMRAVEQTVQTKSSGKTCALDAKTDHVIVITREAAPAAPETAAAAAPAAPAEPAAPAPQRGGPGRGRQGGGGPQVLDVIFIGR